MAGNSGNAKILSFDSDFRTSVVPAQKQFFPFQRSYRMNRILFPIVRVDGSYFPIRNPIGLAYDSMKNEFYVSTQNSLGNTYYPSQESIVFKIIPNQLFKTVDNPQAQHDLT